MSDDEEYIEHCCGYTTNKTPGTTPQPAPTTSPRSRDVLPRALECVRNRPWPRERNSRPLEWMFNYLKYIGVTDVAAALEARAAVGLRKYGVPLRTHNGRDAREDLAEEILDAFMYAVQLEMEEEDR